MKVKLIKTSIGIYRLMVENSDYDYAHTSPEYCELQNRDGSYSHKLSLKNCQAIERGYDLDELASDVADEICERWHVGEEWSTAQKGFKLGFQNALELIGYKKFSEEDLRLAMDFGKFGEANNQTTTIGFIQSLQQTEWDVEIVTFTENDLKSVNEDWGELGEPKLDADGCLILKRVNL
jgi:hypothetical protein